MTLIYAKKNWVDTSASGTSITASDLNKFENAINNLTNTVNNLSKVQYYASDSNEFDFTPTVSGVMEAECAIHRVCGAYGALIGAKIATPTGLTLLASSYSQIGSNDNVYRSMRAHASFSGVQAGKTYHMSTAKTDKDYANQPSFSWFITVRPY